MEAGNDAPTTKGKAGDDAVKPLSGPLTLRCPHCGAKVGVECLDWWGKPRRPHELRYEAFWKRIRDNARKGLK